MNLRFNGITYRIACPRTGTRFDVFEGSILIGSFHAEDTVRPSTFMRRFKRTVNAFRAVETIMGR